MSVYRFEAYGKAATTPIPKKAFLEHLTNPKVADMFSKTIVPVGKGAGIGDTKGNARIDGVEQAINCLLQGKDAESRDLLLKARESLNMTALVYSSPSVIMGSGILTHRDMKTHSEVEEKISDPQGDSLKSTYRCVMGSSIELLGILKMFAEGLTVRGGMLQESANKYKQVSETTNGWALEYPKYREFFMACSKEAANRAGLVAEMKNAIVYNQEELKINDIV